MLVLVATLLAQSCSFEDVACFDVLAANHVQAYLVEPLSSAGGVAMQSHRSASDQSADYTLQCKPGVARDEDTPALEYSCNGITWFRVTNSGSVWAGSNRTPETSAAFLSSAEVAVACAPGTGGCETVINGGMLNESFHGAVTLGNAAGIALRDGGLALQVFGTGGRSSPGHTVLAQDVVGNLETYDGLHGSYVQDFPSCDREAGFNNDVGRFRTLGMSGYDVNNASLKVCTSTSAWADGGWETVCTDKNAACSVNGRLVAIEARLTALEAR
jgi:hypothetical protein